MAALAADLTTTNATLAKLVNGLGLSIRQPNGTIQTAYKDRLGNTVDAEVPVAKQAALGKATEFEIQVRVNPDGNTAFCKIVCKSPLGVQAIEGQLDMTVLATKLV